MKSSVLLLQRPYLLNYFDLNNDFVYFIILWVGGVDKLYDHCHIKHGCLKTQYLKVTLAYFTRFDFKRAHKLDYLKEGIYTYVVC